MSHEDVIGAGWCPTGQLVMILCDKICLVEVGVTPRCSGFSQLSVVTSVVLAVVCGGGVIRQCVRCREERE